ncbi:MAG: hypothetical protein AAGK66_10205, partial [Pseudomonadota bacterium]
SDTVGARHPVKPTKPGPLSGLDLSEEANNTPPRVHPDRMLKPAHKAGTLIAFVLDALGLV